LKPLSTLNVLLLSNDPQVLDLLFYLIRNHPGAGGSFGFAEPERGERKRSIP